MGIVEHGNVGLAAAGQIAGAGFGGISEGMQAKEQMNAQVAATQERQMRMDRLAQQLDLEEQQREAESKFNVLQARLGERGLRPEGPGQLYLDDDGGTALPGLKYQPINFSRQEMNAFQKMSPSAQKARLGELETDRELARKRTEVEWLAGRANEILGGAGIYGNPDGSEIIPGMVGPADGLRRSLMDAVEAFGDDPNMDVREAARMLRSIGDGVFDAQKAARVKQQVGSTLFTLHETALADQNGLGIGDNMHAEHVEWIMKEWAAGDMDDGTALSLAGTSPQDLDKILNWGFTRQAQGMSRMGPQQTPMGAPGVGNAVASMGPEGPGAPVGGGTQAPAPDVNTGTGGDIPDPEGAAPAALTPAVDETYTQSSALKTTTGKVAGASGPSPDIQRASDQGIRKLLRAAKAAREAKLNPDDPAAMAEYKKRLGMVAKNPTDMAAAEEMILALVNEHQELDINDKGHIAAANRQIVKYDDHLRQGAHDKAVEADTKGATEDALRAAMGYLFKGAPKKGAPRTIKREDALKVFADLGLLEGDTETDNTPRAKTSKPTSKPTPKASKKPTAAQAAKKRRDARVKNTRVSQDKLNESIDGKKVTRAEQMTIDRIKKAIKTAKDLTSAKKAVKTATSERDRLWIENNKRLVDKWMREQAALKKKQK